MAEPQKNNLPKILIGAAIVGAIAFMATGGGGGSTETAAKTAPKSGSKSSNSYSLLKPEDSHVQSSDFTPVVYNVPDRFTPLIVKAGGPGTNPPALQTELTIPSNFSAGEQGWAFTGTVNIDGKWKALVENSVSGKDDYVVAGQKWKTSTVDKVTENILTLRDISGAIKDVSMQADVQARMAQMQADLAELKASASPVPARPGGGNNYSPVNPFSGNIGMTQDDMGQTIFGAAAAADGGGGNGYGGGFGNRRNRGGGGRGGGGGGRRGGRGGGGGG